MKDNPVVYVVIDQWWTEPDEILAVFMQEADAERFLVKCKEMADGNYTITRIQTR